MLKIAFTKIFDMKENQFDIVFIWLEKNDNVFSHQGSVFPTVPFLVGSFLIKSRVLVQVRFLDETAIQRYSTK